MDGTLHIYHPSRRLLLFAYAHPLADTTRTPVSSASSRKPPLNILLFIGGMFDNFLSTPYVSSLATLLAHSPHWRVIHIQLSSSSRQFGTSSLDKDVSEIVSGINFIRSSPSLGNSSTKVVLMGHSTGCQDVLHYITCSTASSHPPIHGGILQAPVSDRDSLLHSINTSASAKSHYDTCMDIISKTPSSEHRTTLLPFKSTSALFGPVPMSIERFLSLASPNSPNDPGPDDKFSFDAIPSALAHTFGRLSASDSPLRPPKNPLATNEGKVLILISGADEYMHASIEKNKSDLLHMWMRACSKVDESGNPLIHFTLIHPNSRILSHALHDLSGSEPAQRVAREVTMRKLVLRYLHDIEKVGEKCWDALEREEAQVDRENHVLKLQRFWKEDDEKAERWKQMQKQKQKEKEQAEQAEKADKAAKGGNGGDPKL